MRLRCVLCVSLTIDLTGITKGEACCKSCAPQRHSALPTCTISMFVAECVEPRRAGPLARLKLYGWVPRIEFSLTCHSPQTRERERERERKNNTHTHTRDRDRHRHRRRDRDKHRHTHTQTQLCWQRCQCISDLAWLSTNLIW